LNISLIWMSPSCGTHCLYVFICQRLDTFIIIRQWTDSYATEWICEYSNPLTGFVHTPLDWICTPLTGYLCLVGIPKDGQVIRTAETCQHRRPRERRPTHTPIQPQLPRNQTTLRRPKRSCE
jgi:hypothetical protein